MSVCNDSLSILSTSQFVARQKIAGLAKGWSLTSLSWGNTRQLLRQACLHSCMACLMTLGAPLNLIFLNKCLCLCRCCWDCGVWCLGPQERVSVITTSWQCVRNGDSEDLDRGPEARVCTHCQTSDNLYNVTKCGAFKQAYLSSSRVIPILF